MGDIGESGNAVLQTIQASEGGRALRLLRQRQRMRQRMEEEKQKIESKGLKKRNLTFGGSSADRLEDQFKKETIGLLTAQAFKEKRARLEEQIRVEQKSLFPQKLQEKRRMELCVSTSKLSFGDSEEADEVLVQAVDKAFRTTAAEAAAAAAAAVPAPAPVSAASHHASLSLLQQQPGARQQQGRQREAKEEEKKKEEQQVDERGEGVSGRVKVEERTAGASHFSGTRAGKTVAAAERNAADAVGSEERERQVPSTQRSDNTSPGRAAAAAGGGDGSTCSGARGAAAAKKEEEEQEANAKNEEMAETLNAVWRRRRRIGKDPTVDTNFLPDKDRDAQVLHERQRLIEEYQRLEAEARMEPLWVTYSFWDGTGHRRRTCVRKGSTVLQFLDQARSELEKEFVELRGLSAADLLYVKEDLILPHNTTFYDLIKTKARGKSGPLFTFNVHEDVRVVNDSRMEKADSHAGKVVERKWFERNKHIFPASRWEVYNPQKAYDTYTIHGGVHKWKGISNSEIREAIV